jgi:hypothetical protein
MSTITAILEPAADGTLHVPVPRKLRHAKFKVVAMSQDEATGNAPSDAPAAEAQRQRKLLDVLEEISKSNPFRGIDPMAWQREMRADRDLPFSNDDQGHK